ncbi:MAG: DUF349 domain-containing protein [Actinobacteria bacterium]|nr:DUF349 domain-containing protein [Actinomycetota bacterium]
MNEISPNQSAAAALIGDPANFGRVADDGTVYVRTPDGEKAVGSYPGKSPEEALGYFVRKFEALASEVALLAARVRSGAMVPQDATIAVNRLRTNVKELNGVGDLQALASAVEQIIPAIEDGRGAYEAKKLAEKALKAAQRETALAVKEKIVAEAQSLALSESWKTTGDRLKVLLDEWKVAPRLDKKTDAEMWKKFSSSRNKFDKRRRTHFATLDAAQNKVAEAMLLKRNPWLHQRIGSLLPVVLKLLWIYGRHQAAERRTKTPNYGRDLR